MACDPCDYALVAVLARCVALACGDVSSELNVYGLFSLTSESRFPCCGERREQSISEAVTQLCMTPKKYQRISAIHITIRHLYVTITIKRTGFGLMARMCSRSQAKLWKNVTVRCCCLSSCTISFTRRNSETKR